jgi:hypothetical protein
MLTAGCNGFHVTLIFLKSPFMAQAVYVFAILFIHYFMMYSYLLKKKSYVPQAQF